MKRIVAALGAVALVATVAVSPAMARGRSNYMGSRDTLDNFAYISTDATVKANTGGNTQYNSAGGSNEMYPTSLMSRGGRGGSHGGYGGSNTDITLGQDNLMGTGTAIGNGVLTLEANNGAGCNCFDDVDNVAKINTTATVRANTGRNSQSNYAGVEGNLHGVDDLMVDQANGMTTGGAQATADIWTVVNSQMSFAD